jgi:hypothetical protein
MLLLKESPDSQVDIATDYGLDCRGAGVRIPEGLKGFALVLRRRDLFWSPPSRLYNEFSGK